MAKKPKATIPPILVVLEGLYAAGEMAPIPYIKGVASLGIFILKMIDNATMNDKDIQELAERVGQTIITLNDVALTYLRTDNGDVSILKELCANFMRCLEHIIRNLEIMQSNNASKSRIMQYLMTANVRDEINGFARQVDNLQRNFDTNNIMSIRAHSGHSFRTLEQNMREIRAEQLDMTGSLRTLEHEIKLLRVENSDLRRTLSLLVVMQEELHIQLSEQGRLIAQGTKEDSSEWTVVAQSTIENNYQHFTSLAAKFFSMVSYFINFLSTSSALSTRGAKIRRRLSPSMAPFETAYVRRRKALFIVFDYRDQRFELGGRIEDAANIRNLLMRNGYQNDHIPLLTRDTRNDLFNALTVGKASRH
ncbi:hypothetical protein IW262DRAFT_1421088 [Armillaria fumosa]|nr:hypothetical protein IW262DRAFT_1421088 [Armillaria fumosa]